MTASITLTQADAKVLDKMVQRVYALSDTGLVTLTNTELIIRVTDPEYLACTESRWTHIHTSPETDSKVNVSLSAKILLDIFHTQLQGHSKLKQIKLTWIRSSTTKSTNKFDPECSLKVNDETVTSVGFRPRTFYAVPVNRSHIDDICKLEMSPIEYTRLLNTWCLVSGQTGGCLSFAQTDQGLQFQVRNEAGMYIETTIMAPLVKLASTPCSANILLKMLKLVHQTPAALQRLEFDSKGCYVYYRYEKDWTQGCFIAHVDPDNMITYL